MAKVLKEAELPRSRSVRDGRARIDLVTDETFALPELKADRVRFQPGDTAAAHYHTNCKHFFFILGGKGMFHTDTEQHRLDAGDVVMVEESEVHWFVSDDDSNLEFIELWVPVPKETVWTDPNDT